MQSLEQSSFNFDGFTGFTHVLLCKSHIVNKALMASVMHVCNSLDFGTDGAFLTLV